MYSFIYLVNCSDGGMLIKTDIKTLKWVSEYCGIISGLSWDLCYISTSRSAFPTIPAVTGSRSDFEKVMRMRGNSRKLNGKLSKVAFVATNC